MNRSYKQKINKETLVLNGMLDQMDLTYIHRTFHSKAREYTIFSGAHGSFFKIYHMTGHKTNLNKLKQMRSYQATFLTTTV